MRILPRGDRASLHAEVASAQASDTQMTEAARLKLLADIAKADQRLQAQRASLDEAGAHRLALEQQMQAITAPYNARTLSRERELIALADPRIHALLRWIDSERDRLPSCLTRFDGAVLDPATGTRRHVVQTNQDAIRTVLAALVEAKRRAEALMLVTVPDVDAAVAAIRASVPLVHEVHEALA